ncbi:MAG: tetratricopeptide repeat protein [Pseudomonadota bacterium]|nr:tetratricopeptide repeat protein [Pseudomonadota bacterium]
MNPAKISELVNSALSLHNQGNIEQADQIYQAILREESRNFDANHLHGLVLSQKGEHTKALPFLKQAVKQQQNNFEANNNLGLAYKNLKQYKNAEKHFLKAISIDETGFKAYLNCANLYLTIEEYDKAIEFLFKCISINGETFDLLRRIAEVYNLEYLKTKNENLLLDAEKYGKKAMDTNPQAEGPYHTLAMTYLWLGKIQESLKFFKEYNSILQSTQKEFGIKHGDCIRNRLADPASLIALIKHEFEQLTFIDNDSDGIRNTKFSKEYYEFLKNNYKKIEEGSFQPTSINEEEKKLLLKQLYNKPPKSKLESYVNKNNNILELEKKYVNSIPEVVVIDNFLSEEALLELQKFCYSSNIFKLPYSNGYLGAFLAKGMANEFMLELSEEIRKTYKKIFTNTKLAQAWIFKYDNKCKGINLHADDAEVNLNLWISQESANLNPETGGLIIWDKFPNKNATFYDFNINTASVAKQLEEKKIGSTKVPYRENRAVIFNSMLYHATDDYKFRDDYKDRRLNITFLYD